MPDKILKKSPNTPVADDTVLFSRIVGILEEARSHVVRTVNSTMVVAYWLIGREIIEEEQKGSERADYGKALIEGLSKRLSERYGRGYSAISLWNMRKFYQKYMDRTPAILSPVGKEAGQSKILSPVGKESAPKQYPTGTESATGFHPNLSWSHYRALMRVENDEARQFYEQEAARNSWNKRQLERQINTLLFERLLKSRDKDGVLQLASEGHVPENPIDIIKDPYALEFLDLPESHRLVESDLETALTNHMQEFLLELGDGFAFVSRQRRLTLDGDHFYADLVFYHVRLKCYVIIDLKTEKLTHGDIGQIQMYVHYFDREVCTQEDNPTIGLILCTDKNDAVVEYVFDNDNERIFASRYKLELPPKEELRRLLLEWRSKNEEDNL
ncbi:MAG: PDDEXK nuclease domain-containing protein [Gammaproteobacteria bacterium]|nr:PDDEXK nuclease domain-containing protein [Gammaproteobacteria bacterium]MCY4283278.1 PDDEXK nuclease domain-containing protein [Gammaproteobacteria bacterium]MCY4339063.1 PDDEXK nuclease domain-containing protein [Gammaproteobacteria bacterium]